MSNRSSPILGAFLDWALESFSGYVAADELYEGPYCVVSVVDNRAYKRILYEGLDDDPTHDDITALLQRLKTALTDRDLELRGITPDGSPLYPEPIRTVFGDVAHQAKCPISISPHPMLSIPVLKFLQLDKCT